MLDFFDSKLAAPPKIDAAWQVLIDTSEYPDLCRFVFPDLPDDHAFFDRSDPSKEDEGRAERYAATRGFCRAVFAEEPGLLWELPKAAPVLPDNDNVSDDGDDMSMFSDSLSSSSEAEPASESGGDERGRR